VILAAQGTARQTVHQSIKLNAEPKEEAGVMIIVRSAMATDDTSPMIEGEKRSYALGMYDVKLCGEVVTHPHLRVQSHRAEHQAKLCRGFLRGHLPESDNSLTKENFPEPCMLSICDGGKHQGGDVS
jgi:hypothetical protein